MQNDYTSGEKRIESICDLLNCTYCIGLFKYEKLVIFFRKVENNVQILYRINLEEYESLKEKYKSHTHPNKNKVLIDNLIKSLDRQISLIQKYVKGS